MLLAGLARAMAHTGQSQGADFDLDFHAIMHFGDDVALESHYVPRRSQRTEAVLTFFAHDATTHNFVYANATCTKADQASEVWSSPATGSRPPAPPPSCWCSTTQGLSNREIAESMFVSQSTVKFHVRNVMRKLDARRRAEVAYAASRLGLLGEMRACARTGRECPTGRAVTPATAAVERFERLRSDLAAPPGRRAHRLRRRRDRHVLLEPRVGGVFEVFFFFFFFFFFGVDRVVWLAVRGGGAEQATPPPRRGGGSCTPI